MNVKNIVYIVHIIKRNFPFGKGWVLFKEMFDIIF
jgi:hypothetical protein